MKKFTKALALLLALVLGLAALASCKTTPGTTDTTTEKATDAATDEVTTAAPTYSEISKTVYDAALGEYLAAYDAAKAATSVSERFALMAIAEAKLLEAGVMVPTTTRGGNYAISRVVPRSLNSTLWGNDNDRLHNAIITTELIKAEDRAALKALWNEKRGTGEYDTAALAFLAEKGYTTTDVYNMAYSSDVNEWDILATSRAVDAEVLVNTFDGLLEYDDENVQKPALAESYEVSADGLTYTFHIRQGVKWVDSQGTEIAEVTADDFVAAAQHMMDATDEGLGWLIKGVVAGVTEYMAGTETDFSKVGVKATDTYTLVYTLEAPCSYFLTMLAYSCFAPMNRAYYLAKGGAFGIDAYTAALETEAYQYAKGPDSIVYCGPYLITNATAKSTVTFQKNDKYWNKDNVRISTINWYFNDGTDTLKAYNDAKAGTTAGAGLNASALEQSKKDGLFDTYAYVSDTDATSFMAFFNINRAIYANANGSLVSPMTDEQKAASAKAMSNQNFRQALAFAFDRASYNAQSVGDDLKLVSLRNSYTPGNFVSLAEEVTVKIGGADKTYAAGTYYGQILQDQLNADNCPVKVWDAESEIGDGFDGWYNVANAKAQLALAIAELAKDGITVDADHPIYIDMPYFEGNDTSTKRANSLKKSIEDALEGKVKVNIIPGTQDDYYDACYYFDYGNEANYTINTLSGWGPDYGDPQTYLDTFLPEGNGYMVKSIGVY